MDVEGLRAVFLQAFDLIGVKNVDPIFLTGCDAKILSPYFIRTKMTNGEETEIHFSTCEEMTEWLEGRDRG